MFWNPVSLFALLLGASLGCADGGTPTEGTLVEAIDTYVPQQGRLLLGFKNPDVRIFSFAGSLPATRVVNGQLVAGAISGTGFTGVKFTGDGGLGPTDMRIAQVIPPDETDNRWQYVLEQRIPNTTTWEPACDAPLELVPPVEPQFNPPRAVAMPGLWFGPFYWVQSSFVTFACKTGVVAKCDGWGFPVTKVWPNVTKHGLTTFATGADLMQACSRMGRADYCAAGMPNTLDGTPIQIDNVFTGLQSHEGFTFEAAWAGKAINDRVPQPLQAICLTKLRWSTMPLGGNCPLVLPDPRVDAKGKFCEDISPIDLERKGALLYSSSSYMDAGLYTYTDPDTKLRLTTASLLPRVQGELPEWQIAPPADVHFPVAGQPVRFEATIFARALPVSIPDVNLAKLFSYRCDNDLITTTTAVTDQGCNQIAMEGHVYPPGTAGRAPLRRWYNPSIKHSYTTAISPTTMMADGWNLVEVVGGVLRASIDVNLRWSSLPGYSYTVDAQTGAGGWITSCIDSAHIGSSTSFAYRGVCVGSANMRLNHSDIIAFRVTYTRSGFPTLVATQAYDGFSSDAYIALDAPDSLTTAVAVSWSDLGGGTTYAVDVRVGGGDWLRCADNNLLGSSTSYLHTGHCWSANASAQTHKISELRVCAFDPGKTEERMCIEAKYDGHAPTAALLIKK
jgi:hypothetical protein